MKVKRMEITEILRRTWLFSANKIKSSKYVSKQPTTQLIIAAEIRHISLISGFAKKKAFLTVTSFFFYIGKNSRLRTR